MNRHERIARRRGQHVSVEQFLRAKQLAATKAAVAQTATLNRILKTTSLEHQPGAPNDATHR